MTNYSFSGIDAAVIIVYFAAMIIIGMMFSKKIKDVDSFGVADRSLSMKIMVGTTVATCMGAATAIGDVGMVYDIGVIGFVAIATWNIGWIALICLAKRLRASGASSLPDFLEKKYGLSTKTMAAVVSIVYVINVTAAQIAACGRIAETLALTDFTTGAIIGGIIIILYTVFGGLYAVAFTDTIQAVLLFFGVVIAVPIVAFFKAGGVGHVVEVTAQTNPDLFSLSNIGIMTLVGYILSYMLAAGSNPAYVQRILASKDEKTAFWGSIWSNLITLIICMPIAAVAFSAHILFPEMANGEMSVPSVIYAFFPPFVKGLVLAALIALVMSTADSFLLLLGTTMSTDIVKVIRPQTSIKTLLTISRITVVLGGLLGIALALHGGSVFLLFRMGAAAYGAGMFVPVVCACFWKRATTKGINWGMISGCFLTVLWNLILRESTGIEGVIVGAAVCLVFTVAISMMDNKTKTILDTKAS